MRTPATAHARITHLLLEVMVPKCHKRSTAGVPDGTGERSLDALGGPAGRLEKSG